MKRIGCIGGVLTMALCLAGRVEAQTAYGPGGLLVHPSAFTRPQGALGLNISWFSQRIAGQSTSEWLPVNLVYGVSDRAEIGVTYLNRQFQGSNRSSGGLFGKFQIAPDTDRRPALALVGSYLDGDVKLSSIAGVASHRFRQGDRTLFTGHVGVQWARRADISPASDALSAFVGLEIPLNRELSLVGEFGSRFAFDQKDRSSIGLIYTGRSGYQIAVGFVNMGRSSEQRFFAGVGFPLGGRK